MWSLVFACLTAIQGGSSAQPVSGNPALTLETTIPMPGVTGRIDHLCCDAFRERVFVAALEHGTVQRLWLPPLDQKRPPFDDVREPQGLVYDDAILYVTDGAAGRVWCFADLDYQLCRFFLPNWKAHYVEIGDDADNIRLLPKAQSLLVGYGHGALGWVSIPNPRLTDFGGFEVQGRVELGGHPESFQFDAAEKRCWVNVPDKQSIAVVDLEARKVLRWIEVKPAKRNYPMALAESEKRLLVGCREPAKLLVYDIDTDALAAELPLSGDVDDLFVDTDRNLLYASCGEGFLDVFERTGPGTWKPKEKIQTSPGARTCLFVPSAKKLFLAVPHRGEQQAEIRVFSTAP